MPSQEQERLKRMRDRQLAARDPLVKQREFQRAGAVKEKRARKPFSFSKAWRDFPHVVRTPIYALLLGLLVSVVLPVFWNSPLAFLVGAVVTLILILFGVIVGNALDLRDDIKDNLR
jgi:predicted permease